MTAQRRDIEAQIKALSNLKPMFGALKSIAGTARRSVGLRRQSASIYADIIRMALSTTLLRMGDRSVRFAETGTGPIGLVVVSSDRGLCDVYNKRIISATESFIDFHKGRDINLIALGLEGERYFEQHGLEIILSVSIPVHGHLYYEEVRHVASKVFDLHGKGKFSEVWVAHSLSMPHGVFETAIDRYLPPDLIGLQGKQEEEECLPWDPVSEIEPQEMLRYIVPEYLSIVLYHYLLESMFVEQTMRYRAMNVASSHTDDRIAALIAIALQVRQSEITTETLEVSAGSEATKRRKPSEGTPPFDLIDTWSG